MRFILLLCSLMLFLNGCSHHSSHKDTDPLDDANLKKWGITHSLKGNTLFVFVNSEQTFLAISDWKKLGFIDPSLRKFKADQYPFSVALDGAEIGVCNFLYEVYDNKKQTDELKVKVYIISPDDYGNMNQHLAYYFDFNRYLFNKIDWKYFNCNFNKISKNFIQTNWLVDRLNEEPIN